MLAENAIGDQATNLHMRSEENWHVTSQNLDIAEDDNPELERTYCFNTLLFWGNGQIIINSKPVVIITTPQPAYEKTYIIVFISRNAIKCFKAFSTLITSLFIT
jgi:hypothetical protein